MAKAVTLHNTSNEEVYPVTDASLVNGTLATNQIADNAITPAKAAFTSYSTAEAAIGTWVDGKTIYRKTFQVNSGPKSGSDVSIPMPTGTTAVLSAWGYLTNNSFSIFAGGARQSNVVTAQLGVLYENSTNNIVLESNSDRSGFSGYVTAEYIK